VDRFARGGDAASRQHNASLISRLLSARKRQGHENHWGRDGVGQLSANTLDSYVVYAGWRDSQCHSACVFRHMAPATKRGSAGTEVLLLAVHASHERRGHAYRLLASVRAAAAVQGSKRLLVRAALPRHSCPRG
jgi:GNAT superfamily N-acetyltransferase